MHALLLYLLLVTATLIPASADQIQLISLPVGLQFVPSNPSTLLSDISGINSRLQCTIECLNNIRCLSINFDSSTQQCSLFASWLSEGSTSLSSTSQVVSISRVPTLYTSYQQPCTASFDPINRYMQCVNSVWTCPNGYFFNGEVCERLRSVNMSCLTSDWCDASKYLICSNLLGFCQCNSSMEWDGSQCVLICLYSPLGITFDTIPNGNVVPNGYGGLNWSNLEGCYVSNDNRACNTNTNSISFTRPNGTLFLKRLVLGVFVNTTSVTLTGTRYGIAVLSWLISMNTDSFALLPFNLLEIDTMTIDSTPQGQTPIINIDGICYVV